MKWIGHSPTIYTSDGIRAGSPRTLKKLPWEIFEHGESRRVERLQ